MAQKIYGSVNPETGELLSTRAVQGPTITPKIEDYLEKENIGFWQNVEDQATYWLGGGSMVRTEDIKETAALVGASAKKVGLGLGSTIQKLVIITALVAAIIIIPRIMPVSR